MACREGRSPLVLLPVLGAGVVVLVPGGCGAVLASWRCWCLTSSLKTCSYVMFSIWRRRGCDGDGAVGGDGASSTAVTVAGGRLAGLRLRKRRCREDSDARRAKELALPKLGGDAEGEVDGGCDVDVLLCRLRVAERLQESLKVLEGDGGDFWLPLGCVAVGAVANGAGAGDGGGDGRGAGLGSPWRVRSLRTLHLMMY